MTDSDTQKVVSPEVVTETAPAPAVSPKTASLAPARSSARGGQGGDRRNFRKNPRKGGQREGRARPEFEQKIIDIRRVTRVAAGGKRFNFSVAMIAGNRNGAVGVGLGKGADTAIAIDKAFRSAKKHMIHLKLVNRSIPHEIYSKYSSARVSLKPARGRGVIAGSAARLVLELGGVQDINAKLLSPTKNKLNIARATIQALSFFKTKLPLKA